MPTLADVFGFDYAFVSGFLAARDQVCKTLTGTLLAVTVPQLVGIGVQ